MQVGNNDFNNSISSMYYNGGFYALDTLNKYYVNGIYEATIPTTAYALYFFPYNLNVFYYPSNSYFYAFNGSGGNYFTLQGSRQIIYYGTAYTTGFTFPTGNQGLTAVLFWNGIYYSVIANIGGGSPY
jgi:hypothetical protein